MVQGYKLRGWANGTPEKSTALVFWVGDYVNMTGSFGDLVNTRTRL